jgi:uncharacterized membrane protein (DUF2068 family)
MNNPPDLSFRGRSLGIVLLVAIQFVVGVIHTIFGLMMLSGNFSATSFSLEPTIYSIYTLVYGCLTLIFTYLLWLQKRSGWLGTIAVSLFVIFADTLTVFNLLPVLGIPNTAALGEIPFSIIIIAYLVQAHVRSEYNT